MILTPEEKSKARAALLKAGIKTRRMTDEEISTAYREQLGTTTGSPAPRRATIEDTAPTTPTTTENAAMTSTATSTATTSDLAAKIAELITSQTPAAPAFDEKAMIELIKKHSTKAIEVTAAPDVEPIRIEGAHPALERVVTWLSTRTNVYLVGPAGSGKTTLAEQAAKALDLPFFSSGAIMASYELTGFRDAHGKYTPSPLRTAFEHGGVFLLDEIDACSAKALVCFNMLLANNSFTFPDGMVKKSKDFVVVAGANTAGTGANRQYIGRNPLDGASLNRFVQIEINYCKRLELRLAESEYVAHGGQDIDLLKTWVALVVRVRHQLEEMKSTAIISPRASIFGARGLAKGLTIGTMAAELLTCTLSVDQKARLDLY